MSFDLLTCKKSNVRNTGWTEFGPRIATSSEKLDSAQPI